MGPGAAAMTGRPSILGKPRRGDIPVATRLSRLSPLGGWIVIFVTLTATAQSSRYPVQEKETNQRTLEFSGAGNRTVELDNVSGSIQVTGTNGRSVEMVANKTIRGESQDRIEDAKRD